MALTMPTYTDPRGYEWENPYMVISSVKVKKTFTPVDPTMAGLPDPGTLPQHLCEEGNYGSITVDVYRSKADREKGTLPIAQISERAADAWNAPWHEVGQLQSRNPETYVPMIFKIRYVDEGNLLSDAYDHLTTNHPFFKDCTFVD